MQMTALETFVSTLVCILQSNTCFTFIDAPTNAPGWSVPLLGPGQTDRQTPARMNPVAAPSTESHASKGASVSKGEV